jgi:hypothetical protein
MVISILGGTLVSIVTKLFILPRQVHKKAMHKCLVSLDAQKIREGRQAYVKARAWEFTLATILMLGVLVTAWLYILNFCEIYAFTAKSWVTSGLLSIFISLFLVQTVNVTLHIVCRTLAKCYRNE